MPLEEVMNLKAIGTCEEMMMEKNLTKGEGTLSAKDFDTSKFLNLILIVLTLFLLKIILLMKLTRLL